MLHCHLEVCILLGQEEPIIFLWVMVDPRGVCGVKNLYSLFLINSGVETWKTLYNVFSFKYMYIIAIGGSNYELWWIQQGWRVCNSLCSIFSWMANWKDLKLCQIIYYSQNGRIQGFFWICGGSIWVESAKRLVLTSPRWLCTILHCHLLMCKLFWQKDPILSMVDPKGMEDVK
jgi:hypothetical protein